MKRVLSLFSGIGAFEKALKDEGIAFELVNFCEFDKFAVKSYCAVHEEKENKNLGDITKVDMDNLPQNIDLLTHGSPCQDFSVAGNGKGAEVGSNTRSSLMWNSVEIIGRIRPKVVIWENVKNVLSPKHRHNFDKYLTTLEVLGYKNYYKVLNAKEYGTPQNRERIFVVSILGQHDPFEFEQGFDNGIRLKDILEKNVEEKYYIADEKCKGLIERLLNSNQEISYCIDANYWKGTTPQQFLDKSRRQLVVETPCIVASRGRNPENPSDRTPGNYVEQRLEPNTKGLCNTITSVQKDNYVLENQLKMVGMLDMKGNDCIRRVYDESGICPTLTNMQGGHREPKVLVKEATKKGYAVAEVGDSINMEQPNSKTRMGRVGKQVAQTLTCSCNQATLENNFRIRKLTPTECWILQGFTKEDIQKARDAGISNSQLYKQAGNSIYTGCLTSIYRSLNKSVWK